MQAPRVCARFDPIVDAKGIGGSHRRQAPVRGEKMADLDSSIQQRTARNMGPATRKRLRSQVDTQRAEFLRRCRTRIDPAELGLPQPRRKRTAGLRREDVAALSGVSASWYTWLEQGRDMRVS